MLLINHSVSVLTKFLPLLTIKLCIEWHNKGLEAIDNDNLTMH